MFMHILSNIYVHLQMSMNVKVTTHVNKIAIIQLVDLTVAAMKDLQSKTSFHVKVTLM